MAGKPGIDHAGVLNIEESEAGGSEQETQCNDSQEAETKGGSPETFLNTQSQTSTPRGWANTYCRAREKRNKAALSRETEIAS
jgi:hypothetical protein